MLTSISTSEYKLKKFPLSVPVSLWLHVLKQQLDLYKVCHNEGHPHAVVFLGKQQTSVHTGTRIKNS